MTFLKSQAIKTALVGDWTNAISLNKKLLKEDPHDIDTLNRLAFAYTVIGRLPEAKKTYQKVLRIDKKNPIALKSIKKLSGFSLMATPKIKKGKERKKNKEDVTPIVTHANNLFLEESGKTKIVELVNVAQPKVISSLLTGEMLKITVKRLKVFVLDEKNRYIGVLPDNIAKRLIALMKGGNTYQAYVKSAQNTHISIFIKETKRANKFRFQPSFILSEKGKIKFEKFPKTETEVKESQEEE